MSHEANDDAQFVDFPMQTFVDEGLLHYVNRNVFWPLGMALTVDKITSSPERIAAFIDELTSGGKFTPEQLSLRGLRRCPSSAVLPGLFLQQNLTAPTDGFPQGQPEAIRTALSVDEARARYDRAIA